MDELEKHIKNRRAGMDILDPDPGLWDRIKKGLPRQKIHISAYLWRAAAAVIIVVVGLTVIFRTVITPQGNDDPLVTAVKETYMYYNSQIRSLYKEAQPFLTAYPEISTELDNGMGELDSLSMQIRNDLSDNIANEEVVEALIRNYRLRIELLEDMLALMREKESENENHTDHEL